MGGVIIKINKEKKFGELEIIYINPEEHSKGIGFKTWNMIEKMHPEIGKLLHHILKKEIFIFM